MSNFNYQVCFEKDEFRNWPLNPYLKELFDVCAQHLIRFVSGFVVINLVSASTMQKLNCQIYPFKKESDVLALPFHSENDLYTPETLIGEIYLNYSQTQTQAQKYGHSWLRECAFLVLHAFMHLLSYEHQTIPGEELMLGLQKEILQKLQILRV